VVICGAGFGGLSAISGLTRAGLRVTLVDSHLYSTFQPLLYQVATGGLNPGDVAYPAGGVGRRYGAVFRRGELATIDPASRRVKLTNGLDLGYDYLIVATGVTTAYGHYAALSRVHPAERLPRAFAGLPSGHSGSHQFLVDDFVRACAEGVPPPNNVWQAARYGAPGIVAHQSAVQGGRLLEVPDFGDPPA